MKIPFFKSEIKAADRKNLLNKFDIIVKSGLYTNNKLVKRFENYFRKFNNIRYCSAVNTGTSALHLALIALGIKKDDEVIIPSISFYATASAVAYIGAKPVIADVNKKDWLIDENIIPKLITKKTKAIIVVHLHGLMCDMKKIKKIAKINNLKIIEDASQAHGALYENHPPGKYSDIATFSFYPTKNLGAIGEGGAVITNYLILDKKIKALRDWGNEKNNSNHYSFNYRMSELIAASLIIKLKNLSNDVERRIAIATLYKKLLKNDRFSKFDITKRKHSYHIFCIRVENRKIIMKYLKKNNIGFGVHYEYALNDIPVFKQSEKVRKINNNYSVSSDLTKTFLSLPIYPALTDKQIKRICKLINEFK